MTKICATELFFFYFFFIFLIEGNFRSRSPRGLYSEGPFNGGCFALRVCVVIFERAYTYYLIFIHIILIFGILRHFTTRCMKV